MVKVHITTLGCPKNVVDSAHLIREMASEGLIQVDRIEDADVLLVNTCGFIKDAKEESIEEILTLGKIKASQGAGVEGKHQRRLLVFGCLAQRYRDELLKEIPEIDALWGVGEDEKIVEYCKAIERAGAKGKGPRNGERAETIAAVDPVFRTQDFLPSAASYAYLKVAEGCDKRCTFCVIPSIRGRFRSMNPDAILKEAEGVVRSGLQELILVAQDITDYGKELHGYTLVSLLKDLTSLPGAFRVRLLYLYPTSISDDLLELIATEEKIVKYLDLPLQHSEDRILRMMGRRGTRKEYLKLIRQIRKSIPEVTLRTSLIVGFPSETEEDFNGLVDFIEEVRFDRLGVFKYSREEGTRAAKCKGQVPERLKEKRMDEIMKRQALISLERNRELVGRRFDTIIDEVDGNVVLARLPSQAPEIDGVVIIEKPRVMSEERGPSPSLVAGEGVAETPGSGFRALRPVRIGDVITVEIVDAYDYDLKGVIVEGVP